jgi:3D-(3,5/4)-trihydroxycyclohexane-1,2-dione acylhydrolase (decyclizing)
VVVLVGDGSYLMMAQEIVTAVQEGIKLIIVLVDNQGFASIGALSESVGAQRFGTSYRYRGRDGRLDGAPLPVDLTANAASLGAVARTVTSPEELTAAIAQARAAEHTTVLRIETDPLIPAPDGGGWWDVPVAEVSALDSVRRARAAYETGRQRRRPYM